MDCAPWAPKRCAFVAVYLTTHKWTQVEIGFALTLGTVTSLISQLPAGALVDAVRNKRGAASGALIGGDHRRPAAGHAAEPAAGAGGADAARLCQLHPDPGDRRRSACTSPAMPDWASGLGERPVRLHRQRHRRGRDGRDR